ncbi:helix-turn-helix transcriptional regulator [Arthrobacter cryoconiti]|uniref:Helix-turn-helix transcriptional regulator n=1 Tax=Arthrobacter cryoconiti TaxID=748907 RepID=A0ABV8R1N0_9MICC|nr:WYL domain-containing protein [Arthrobacter cryoconiti]MCC9069842.1 WYL domain-containing protein [Arthrobacter cryoconiti]
MPEKINATERMLNLVIALLGTTRGRSRQFIRQNVNGYTKEARTRAEETTAGAAFERMFERDKELLRAVGVPITTLTSFDDEDEEQSLYRIRPEDYRAPEIRLDEAAMAVLALAADLWTGAAFSDAAQSALRKVASRSGQSWYDDDATIQSRVRTSEPAFEPLWTALRGSHPVTFAYTSSGSSTSIVRHVQPWGLGSKYGEWYLSGFDTDKGAQRNFRLSRIRSGVSVQNKTTFERPPGFDISLVLSTLGTGTPETAVVQVAPGAAHELRGREGTRVLDATGPGDVEVLGVEYLDPELMADDLAALGSAAQLMEPETLRAAVLARLQSAAVSSSLRGHSESPEPAFGKEIPRARAKKADSRDRLVRLLSMVPYLVANPGISETEICTEFAITGAELEADLGTLMVSGLPGYQHGDLMDVTSEHGQVFIRDAETLASPLRLTQEEACALLVGLQALSVVPGAAVDSALRAAHSEVRKVAGGDAWLADAVALELLSGAELESIATLSQMIRASQAASVSYVVRSRDEITQRVLEPRRIFSVDSTWYVRAWCRNAAALRSFRIDQLQSIKAAGPQLHTDLGEANSSSRYLFTSAGTDTAVELVVDPATALRLAPAYNASVHALVGTPETDKVGLRMLIADSASVPSLIARLAGHGWVVRPQELNVRVQRWLEAALAAYGLTRERASSHGLCTNNAVGESTPTLPSEDR